MEKSMILIVDYGRSNCRMGWFLQNGTLIKQEKLAVHYNPIEIPELIKPFLNENTASIIIGIAGYSTLTEELRESILKHLKKEGGIVLVSDAIFFAEYLPSNSIGILIGTGSILIRKDENGKTFHYGGWGPFYKDALSGLWWFTYFMTHCQHQLEHNQSDSIDHLVESVIGEKLSRDLILTLSYKRTTHEIAQLGSQFLVASSDHPFISDLVKNEVNKFLKPLSGFTEIQDAFLHGGMFQINLVRQSIQDELEILYHKKVQTIDSLLLGGFRYWQKLTQF